MGVGQYQNETYRYVFNSKCRQQSLKISLIFQMNKHNKSEDRAIMVTEKMLFKLDPAKRYKAMTSGVPLAKVMVSSCLLHIVVRFLSQTIKNWFSAFYLLPPIITIYVCIHTGNALTNIEKVDDLYEFFNLLTFAYYMSVGAVTYCTLLYYYFSAIFLISSIKNHSIAFLA